MIKKISDLFHAKKTGGIYAKLSSVSPAVSDKNHKQKINLQGENHYKKRIRKQKFSSVLLRRSRRYICGLLPPAMASGTKREAIWYSELYLSLVDRYANYPKEQGLPQKNEVFLWEEEPQRRLPSTAKAVDEKQSLRRRSELYLFEKCGKNDFYGGDELRRI